MRVSIVAGDEGEWAIEEIVAVVGDSLTAARRLSRNEGPDDGRIGAWKLVGVLSHDRYVTRDEKNRLTANQPGLGREAARCAALIPIRKSPAWWAMTQDERRTVFEETSRHIQIGMDYLPAVARRLYHCRDLGEPFDFLTWFEFAPDDRPAFNELVRRLRATDEWRYVERECEIRLRR